MQNIPTWLLIIFNFAGAVLSLKVVELLINRFWKSRDDTKHTTEQNEVHALAADTQFRADLMNRLKTVEAEQKELQTKFNEQGIENTKLDIENKHLQSTNARQETELDKLRIRNAELESQMQSLEQRFAVIRAELGIVTTNYNNLQAQIKDLQFSRDIDVEKEILRRLGSRRANLPIAVIDDNNDTRRLFTETLRGLHIECEGFSNAEDAMRWFRDNEASAIIADLALTGKTDGSSLVEWIRGHERRNKMIPARIIVYTGYDVSEAMKRNLADHSIEAIMTKGTHTPQDVCALIIGMNRS